jgi:hypothetical protein
MTRRYDNSGLTALHLAASLGYVDIADLLLQLGARVGSKEQYIRSYPAHLEAFFLTSLAQSVF